MATTRKRSNYEHAAHTILLIVGTAGDREARPFFGGAAVLIKMVG